MRVWKLIRGCLWVLFFEQLSCLCDWIFWPEKAILNQPGGSHSSSLMLNTRTWSGLFQARWCKRRTLCRCTWKGRRRAGSSFLLHCWSLRTCNTVECDNLRSKAISDQDLAFFNDWTVSDHFRTTFPRSRLMKFCKLWSTFGGQMNQPPP